MPRANMTFLPIENAWFSGSMNYLGRARRPDGSPEYEATYEINAVARDLASPSSCSSSPTRSFPGTSRRRR